MQTASLTLRSLCAAFAQIFVATAAQADGVGPLTIAKTGHFFVGGKYVESKEGQVLAGQAYVEYFIPTNRTHPYPIVFIEGCCPSGAPYMGTPDGRDGWGQYFLSKGYAVYIMDQVGRGRSPYIASVYGSARPRTPKEIEQEFIAVGKYNMFPQAKLHTPVAGPRHGRRSGVRPVHGGDVSQPEQRRRPCARPSTATPLSRCWTRSARRSWRRIRNPARRSGSRRMRARSW